MYEESGLVIDKIVTDDDSLMNVVVFHLYTAKEKCLDLFLDINFPLHLKKTNKNGGLFNLHIPELGWLADPTHQTKVVAK
eukprot:13884738-Ditylum_brightwellii.AAC.1